MPVEQPNLQNPELIAMITQVVNAVMNQREVGAGNVNAGVNQDAVEVEDNAGGYYEDIEQGIRVGNVPRGRRTGVKRAALIRPSKHVGHRIMMVLVELLSSLSGSKRWRQLFE